MILLVPKIVNLIMERDGLDEIHACMAFYNSDLYAELENEDTDLWQNSAEELYEMYRNPESIKSSSD